MWVSSQGPRPAMPFLCTALRVSVLFGGLIGDREWWSLGNNTTTPPPGVLTLVWWLGWPRCSVAPWARCSVKASPHCREMSSSAPTTFCFEGIKRAAPRPAKPAQRPLPYIKYTSPYHEFSRTQRPLLPTNMKGTDREKAIGQMWRELSEAERAAFKQGLQPEPSSGRGGLRVWAPAPPGTKFAAPPSAAVPAAAAAAPPALTRLPSTPPSAAVTVTFLAPGCSPTVSVAASVQVCASFSAERTAKTSPPSPEPEDQPAAKRRAYPVDQAGSPYPENQQRRAYQEAQERGKLVVRAQPLITTPGHTKRYQAAFALLQHARSVPAVHPPSRAEPPAPPAPRPPLPAVERAVLEAEADREADAEARGHAEAVALLERGGQGEGGHSEGELDRMLFPDSRPLSTLKKPCPRQRRRREGTRRRLCA